MKEINEKNLTKFLEHYHYLHDSYIRKIDYNITNSQIIVNVDVGWSGTASINKDGTYKTNFKKIKMVFNNIKKYKITEIFTHEIISKINIEYIELNNKKYIRFIDDEEWPSLNIVCENIKYEEINF